MPISDENFPDEEGTETCQTVETFRAQTKPTRTSPTKRGLKLEEARALVANAEADENFPDEEGTETDTRGGRVHHLWTDENFPDEEGTETFKDSAAVEEFALPTRTSPTKRGLKRPFLGQGAQDQVVRRELPRRRGD